MDKLKKLRELAQRLVDDRDYEFFYLSVVDELNGFASQEDADLAMAQLAAQLLK